MDTRTKGCSILMLPWLSHDNILSFLDLGKLLSHRNFCIHVCTTPANLNFLKHNLSEKDSISIKLVELQVPSLPTAADVEVAKPSFHKILLTLGPDLVLYDFLHSWAPVVAGTQNIPAVLFLSSGAASSSYILHSLSNPSAEYPFPAISSKQHGFSESNPVVDSERLLHSIQMSTNMVLIRTSRSIEEKYIDHLSELSQKKIVPVGSLVQVPDDEPELPSRMIEWLDKKGRGSTVVVSLGSEHLSREEMEQISQGLKLSGANFIWAGEQEALPEGFLDEVGERAMIMEGWEPQARILSHSSVAGFMCHCWWRSVMDSIKLGVPVIALPMSLEQALNVRLVEEIGAGKEAVRNKDGYIEEQELERAIREMLQVNQSGKFLQEIGTKLKENEQKEMDDAVEEMEKLRKKVDRLNSLDDMLIQYKS